MILFHSFEYPDDGRSPVRRTEIYAADIDDAARLAVDRVADGYFVGGVMQDDLVASDTDALVARSDTDALDALKRALAR